MQRAPGWERPHWHDGAGAPYLAWFVPGKFDPALRRGIHELGADLPDGVAISVCVLGEADFPSFLWRGLLGHLLEEDFPHRAADIRAAPHVVRLEGTVSDGATLDYLRRTIDAVASLVRAGGLGVCDPIAFKWWSEEAFVAQLALPRRPMPFQLVSILQSPEEGRSSGATWLYTRGLRLFGRPDVSVRCVEDDDQASVTDVLNRLIATAALGASIPPGHAFTLSSGAILVAEHRGALDDPTFNNAHVLLVKR